MGRLSPFTFCLIPQDSSNLADKVNQFHLLPKSGEICIQLFGTWASELNLSYLRCSKESLLNATRRASE